MKFSKSVLALTLASLGATLTQAAAAPLVDYPQGYRGWHHVKSMLIQPGHDLANPFAGLHHVYANAKALEGLKTGTYPDGAVLVFDLLNYKEGGHAVQEDTRKFIGVMQRDQAKFAATGGWGYEGFAGNSKTERMVTDGGASCHACHAAQKSTGYIFSGLRD